jgi:hypothetical protein
MCRKATIQSDSRPFVTSGACNKLCNYGINKDTPWQLFHSANCLEFTEDLIVSSHPLDQNLGLREQSFMKIVFRKCYLLITCSAQLVRANEKSWITTIPELTMTFLTIPKSNPQLHGRHSHGSWGIYKACFRDSSPYDQFCTLWTKKGELVTCCPIRLYMALLCFPAWLEFQNVYFKQ